jgi:lipid A 4'-phosphatase
MSQGAHFLSDVIFAGVAMALTVAAIYLVFAAIAPTRTRMGGSDGRTDF